MMSTQSDLLPLLVACTSTGDDVDKVRNVVSVYVRNKYHIFNSVVKLRREPPKLNSVANYNIL